MTEPVLGIHHITAIAGDPQRNLDFYTKVLGLRLVKLTVNFDDPGTYHFYFGDASGHPGTILTFFPWVNIRRGRRGTGQVGTVAFQVPLNSFGYWVDRFKQHDITTSTPFQRFDEQVLTLLDPDGLPVELITAQPGESAADPWTGSPVSLDHAVRGFAGPTLLLEGFEETADLLTRAFGMTRVQQSGQRFRFSAGDRVGGHVDIEVRPNESFGSMGAGVVYHIAWRVSNEAEQLAWREALVERGLNVTPVIDRQYFRSIYFREPGGILFEIATDPPGFATDETPETLGTHLKLPEWLEPRRATIELVLPHIKLPQTQELDAH